MRHALIWHLRCYRTPPAHCPGAGASVARHCLDSGSGSQFRDPSGHRFVLAGQRLVALEFRQRCLRIIEIQIQQYAEIAVRKRVGIVGGYGLRVGLPGVLNLPSCRNVTPSSLQATALADSMRGGTSQRRFGIGELALAARQQAQVDRRRGIARILQLELLAVAARPRSGCRPQQARRRAGNRPAPPRCHWGAVAAAAGAVHGASVVIQVSLCSILP